MLDWRKIDPAAAGPWWIWKLQWLGSNAHDTIIINGSLPDRCAFIRSVLVINLAGVAIFLGPAAFGMVANSIFDTANYADLATIPLFVLMAEILFRSGSVDIPLTLSTSWWVGCGRQYATISLSTVFGALSGSDGVAAMLARTLFPTMRNRATHQASIGTMLAGASLAPIILPAFSLSSSTLSNIAGLLIVGSFRVCCWRDCSHIHHGQVRSIRLLRPTMTTKSNGSAPPISHVRWQAVCRLV